MTGLIDHILTQDAQIIHTNRDIHGDQLESSTEDIKIRFRYITVLDKNASREALDSADAMVWFSPSADVQEGSIIKVDDKYWRVDRLIKARRLTDSTTQFLKATVKVHSI